MPPGRTVRARTRPDCGGGRASKRALALQQQEETTRVTRQKTAATHAAATHDASTHDATTMENEEQIHIHEYEGALSLTTPQVPRGITKGIELNAITKGLGTKIPIHIVEGRKRPELPMQAAKLASKGGIAIRDHIPTLTHWKE
ncbi:hypothetical protein BS78_03G159600 [Paspalum vaginatum]|nr:hypothetical protein BS78_03G159600 [Paspalum vaginatum]